MSAETARERVQRLIDELIEAKEAFRRESVEAAPFRVGDVVEARRMGVWREAIVRMVEPQTWGRCWYRVSYRKKDGDWSEAEQRAFDAVRPVGGDTQ